MEKPKWNGMGKIITAIVGILGILGILFGGVSSYQQFKTKTTMTLTNQGKDIESLKTSNSSLKSSMDEVLSNQRVLMEFFKRWNPQVYSEAETAARQPQKIEIKNHGGG